MGWAMFDEFASTITQRTWIGICVTVGHTVGVCGQAFTNPQMNVWVNTSTGDRAHEGKSTRAITGIFGPNTQVGVRQQEFVRGVSRQVKVGIWTM